MKKHFYRLLKRLFFSFCYRQINIFVIYFSLWNIFSRIANCLRMFIFTASYILFNTFFNIEYYVSVILGYQCRYWTYPRRSQLVSDAVMPKLGKFHLRLLNILYKKNYWSVKILCICFSIIDKFTMFGNSFQTEISILRMCRNKDMIRTVTKSIETSRFSDGMSSRK